MTSCPLYLLKEQDAFAINRDLIIRTHFLSNIGYSFMFSYILFTDHFMELKFKFWYLISMKYFEVSLGFFSWIMCCFYNTMQFCKGEKKKTLQKRLRQFYFPFISEKICQKRPVLMQLNWKPCLFRYGSALRNTMEFMLAPLYCRYLHNLYLNLYHRRWRWAKRLLQKAKNCLLLYKYISDMNTRSHVSLLGKNECLLEGLEKIWSALCLRQFHSSSS